MAERWTMTKEWKVRLEFIAPVKTFTITLNDRNKTMLFFFERLLIGWLLVKVGRPIRHGIKTVAGHRLSWPNSEKSWKSVKPKLAYSKSEAALVFFFLTVFCHLGFQMVLGLFRDLKKAQLWALLGEGNQLVPSFWYPAEEFFLKNCFFQTLESVCNKVKKISS